MLVFKVKKKKKKKKRNYISGNGAVYFSMLDLAFSTTFLGFSHGLEGQVFSQMTDNGLWMMA